MYVKSGQANVFIKLLCIRFIHGIGHGEFFHYRLLKKLGYFQPPNGDTDYGYSLSYISEDFLPLPIFDISETPERPQILIKRGVVWFNGVFLFNENRRVIEKILNINLLTSKNIFMMSRLFVSNIYWMLGPFLIFISIITSLILKKYLIFNIFLLGVIINSLPAIIVALFVKSKFKSIMRNKDIFLSFIYYPIEKILHSLGPFFWLYLKIINFDLKNLGKLKTKRI